MIKQNHEKSTDQSAPKTTDMKASVPSIWTSSESAAYVTQSFVCAAPLKTGTTVLKRNS